MGRWYELTEWKKASNFWLISFLWKKFETFDGGTTILNSLWCKRNWKLETSHNFPEKGENCPWKLKVGGRDPIGGKIYKWQWIDLFLLVKVIFRNRTGFLWNLWSEILATSHKGTTPTCKLCTNFANLALLNLATSEGWASIQVIIFGRSDPLLQERPFLPPPFSDRLWASL